MDPKTDVVDRLVLSHGRYRLLALTRPSHVSAEPIAGFAIDTLAGDRLRTEPTLAQARAWLDEQVRRDRTMHPPPARRRR